MYAVNRSDEERYRQQVLRLKYLNALGQKLSNSSTLEQCLSDAGECAMQLVDAERVSFCTLEPCNTMIRVRGLTSTNLSDSNATIPISDSGLHECFFDNKILHTTEFATSPNSAHRNLGQAGYTHLWSFPINLEGRIHSVISVASKAEVDYDEDVTSVLDTLTRLLGSTIERLEAQSKSEQLLNSLIDSCPLMLTMIDENGLVQRVSKFGSKQLGYDDDGLLNKNFIDLHPMQDRGEAKKRLLNWMSMEGTTVDISEELMLNKNGETRWVRQTARRIDDLETDAKALVVCEDIHDIKVLSTRLERQARTDTLTGFANRDEFQRQLQQALQQAERADSKLGVIFFDIDHFKNINDTVGHDTGDQVLRAVAERVELSVSTDTTIARIGGDEFMLLLQNLESRTALEQVAKTIINSLRSPVIANFHQLQVSISMGLSYYPDDGRSSGELTKNADIAMYRAKDLGRNQYQSFTKSLSDNLKRRVFLENELRSALQLDQLSLVYQPQYNMQTGMPTSVETLIRWNHPSEGFIPPDIFVPIAESCGLIDTLTGWILSTSLSMLSKLHNDFPDISIAVNVSALEFSGHGKLYQRVMQALEESKVAANYLSLEMTETALLKHPEQAAELVRQFSESGVRLAIDDFGTGYASMSYLVQLPIDCIKIDRSFVDGIEDDSRKQSVVAGILAISESLKINSVAEGVETTGQLQWLKNSGCRSLQGYLMSRPVPAEQLLDVLSNSEKHWSAAA